MLTSDKCLLGAWVLDQGQRPLDDNVWPSEYSTCSSSSSSVANQQVLLKTGD